MSKTIHLSLVALRCLNTAFHLVRFRIASTEEMVGLWELNVVMEYGIFAIAALVALVLGGNYISDAENVCPHNPTLVAYLLTYGIISVTFQIFYAQLVSVAFNKASKGDFSVYRKLLHVLALLSVIQGGINLWGMF